ncbi:MAG: hypothetical protein L0Z48_08975 [candidate division Zixibacteria bacterium]|nr:hypothetical protein [candidate division Zixibacteria bacterium]
MADKKESKEERVDPNLRYRYIGFEVFPEQKKPFFASEEEKKRHLSRLEEKKKSDEREFSLLFVSSFNRVERVVLFIAAMALIASPALPWFFLPTLQGVEMYFGFSLMTATASQIGALFGTSPLAGAGAALILLNLILAPLGGILLFYALYRKGPDPANPYVRTKKLLRLHGLPVLVYLAIFGLGMAGFKASESSLPIFRDGFDIFDLFSWAGWGFWAVLVAHLLPAAKSADL